MAALPDWLDPLPDAGEQRAHRRVGDRRARNSGARLDGAARARGSPTSSASSRRPGRIAVVCGKGNNGGDGFVAARLLRERGRDVDVLLLGELKELRGDARANAERLPGPPPEPFTPSALDDAVAIIDAILGTGFSGEPREPRPPRSPRSTTPSASVVACDVPSGVDASTGEVAGVAVRPRATATFHAAKPGCGSTPEDARGRGPRGRHRHPAGAPGEPQVGLIADRASDGSPSRPSLEKFAAGSVLVCGGSLGLTGAPTMASEAAMRAGAGYVTACVPSSLMLIFGSHLLEVMSVPLPDADGSFESLGRGAGAGASGSGGRARAGPGWASDRRAGVALAARPRRARAALARRRRPQRPRWVARPARRARGRQPSHAARRGSSRACSESDSAPITPGAFAVPAGGARGPRDLPPKGYGTLVAHRVPRGCERGERPALATPGPGDVL